MYQKDKKIILVTGGVRSGKSRFAQELAIQYGNQVRYIATAEAKDNEMEKRILLHKKNRPNTWLTIEEPLELAKLFKNRYSNNHRDTLFDRNSDEVLTLIDCITIWTSNLLLQESEGNDVWKTENGLKKVEGIVDDFLISLQNYPYSIIIVTNEVGWGGIAMNSLGRVYQDFLGWTNQKIAAIADEVYLVASGIPIKIKPNE